MLKRDWLVGLAVGASLLTLVLFVWPASGLPGEFKFVVTAIFAVAWLVVGNIKAGM